MSNGLYPDHPNQDWSGSKLFGKFISRQQKMSIFKSHLPGNSRVVAEKSYMNLHNANIFFFRPLVKSAYQIYYFLISQPKHMLWVLKQIVSMRLFFWAPKNMLKIIGKKIFTVLRWKFCLSKPMFSCFPSYKLASVWLILHHPDQAQISLCIHAYSMNCTIVLAA